MLLIKFIENINKFYIFNSLVILYGVFIMFLNNEFVYSSSLPKPSIEAGMLLFIISDKIKKVQICQLFTT